MDGSNQCDDCDDTNGSVFPGATGTCNFGSGHDECYEDMLCACVVNGSGDCTGDYKCTPYCSRSETGPIGDGCGGGQTCLYDLLRWANIHGCGITTAVPGTGGGQPCDDDADCRSLTCDRICRGPGCNQDYCQDYCSSDDYCGTGAVC